MKPFSFVHVSDLHLGYVQYNLDVRREDFLRAFNETIEKTVELKPDFIIVAGDIFQQARPSNSTLENAIRGFRKLETSGIPAFAVDGSHDSAPNRITGTVLTPLDSAGLLRYLPRVEGASWKSESCYIYGVPNFRTRRRTEELLPSFYEQNTPAPDPSLFNIFVFHMAVELPGFTPYGMEAEVTPQLIPEGFNYYAGGHLHTPLRTSFKNGYLAYSGCTETVSYEDAGVEKGFFYVEVDGDRIPTFNRIQLETPRRFKVLERDYTSMTPNKITEAAAQLVREHDETGVVLIPVLKGKLPVEARRNEVEVSAIRKAAEKALLVRPIIRLLETEVPEEIIRSIFESDLKDLQTKSFEYFVKIFCERYPKTQAEKIAKLAVDILEPLAKKDDGKAKKTLEDELQ